MTAADRATWIVPLKSSKPLPLNAGSPFAGAPSAVPFEQLDAQAFTQSMIVEFGYENVDGSLAPPNAA